MYNEPGTEPAMTIIWNKGKNPDFPATIDLMKFMGTFADIINEKYRISIRYRPLNGMELWDPQNESVEKNGGNWGFRAFQRFRE